jgi:hypothetical protein
VSVQGGVDVTDTESFAFPLSSSPTVHFIGIGDPAPAQCPGSFGNPQATPGNLCVYASSGIINSTAVLIVDPELNLSDAASARGFTLIPNFAVTVWSSGSWAVTAP